MSDYMKNLILKFLEEERFLSPSFITVTAIVMSLLYYYLTKPRPVKCLVDFDSQSKILPGDERIHVNGLHPDMDNCQLEGVRTIPELFAKGVRITGNGNFLGWRPSANEGYKWMSYNMVNERAFALGCALKELGYGPDSLIGICGVNKPEWVIVDQGILMFSMVLVPLYESLGAAGFSHILDQTALSVIFCDANKAAMILERAKGKQVVKIMITFGNVTDREVINGCQEANIRLMTMEDLEAIGRKHVHDKELPKADDLALICYTSGTTGNPKGVMLTHANLVANVASGLLFLEVNGYKYNHEDVTVSYLPLAHMYERYAQYLIIGCGAKIGFFRGDVKELVKDIQVLRPTCFGAVPRVLNALYDKVTLALSGSWFKSTLFKFAIKQKAAEVRRGIIRKDSIWDILVFRKVQNLLGGKVRFVVSGAAPLSSEVLTFLRAAMGCMVFEGYGQTETTALATLASPFDKSVGHVGPPAPLTRVKLTDVPNLGYFSSNNQGEICLQGPCVMKGYFKDPEKTKETLDENGWLRTGDIGQWLPNGTLKVIDRKKHLFKLCQGEYIAPEKIQIVYCRSNFVSQCYVTGNSLKYCTVGIIIPDEEYLFKWAKDNAVEGSFSDLCKNKLVRDSILEDITRLGKAADLTSYEQVKAIYVHPEPFSIENGLLTPTLKCKRPLAEKAFACEIEELYEGLQAKMVQRKSIF